MTAASTSTASTTNVKPLKHNDTIIIIGAGIFGLSTACELAKRGYTNVTVLDRYPPPVPDGSSVDISRVIRPDYADRFYAKLGLEAMSLWETEYQQYFHKSGLLCATQDVNHPYLEQSKENLRQLGKPVQSFGGNQARRQFPAIHGDLLGTKGYFNDACGWADAEGSILYLARQCASNGVSFLSGPSGTVKSLLLEDGKVVGVRTQSRSTIRGDHFVLAAGAWTSYLIDMAQVSVSNAQPVGFIQLTPEEAKEMEGCPIMINLSTGWFAFPPTPGTNILKVARHGYGYEILRSNEEQSRVFSAPGLTKNNAASNFLPQDAEEALREGLRLFLPKYKGRPFLRSRLCWYTDTRKGDFIVSYHPEYANVFIATGGSGHAFKFLPVLGRYVVDAFEGNAVEEQLSKWGWKPSSEPISKGDGSRGGPPRRQLTTSELTKL
ncbi:hypothetical protein N0V90_011886 [Kalmusia sp. IMI 367209]|nr:hypothetical protein N0V90_011886 [Kalmusia sp. IMI 367209]